MSDQHLEAQVGATLHRRADALNDTPLDFVGVRDRARSIRSRRRRTAAAAVAVAVAAVALPLALLTPDDTRVQEQRRVELNPSTAATGEPAQVSYIERGAGRLITPDGTYDLPENILQIAAFRPDGAFAEPWLALTTTPERTATGTRVSSLAEDYSVIDGAEQTTSLAVRDDGKLFAYGSYDGNGWSVIGQPVDADVDSTRISDDGPNDFVTAVGFVADDQVVVSRLNADSGKQSFAVVAPDDTITPFEGFNHLTSASPVNGLVAGQTEYHDDGTSCSGVLDPLADRPALDWETCRYRLGPFSPDGKFVVGLGLDADDGSSSAAVLDAVTGDPVVDFVAASDSVRVGQVVWEDSTTLLAIVNDGDQQYVLRITKDGTVERIAGPVTHLDEPGSAGFSFARVPMS